MEELEGCVLFASLKQQETQRLRERNRTAKRASRARQRQREQHNDTTADVATAEATAQDVDVDVAPPLQPPLHPDSGSGSGSDSVCVRAKASDDFGVWALDGPLDDPTALPWPSSLDEDWPGFSGSLVDTLSPRQLSVSVPGICNPEPRAPPASSSSLISNSNDFNSKPLRLLHIAARNGTTGILLSLIKAGADVNSRDCSGTTPLHIAVRFGRASALELLVSHGANMNARDSANMTALEVAVRARDEEFINIPLSGEAELH